MNDEINLSKYIGEKIRHYRSEKGLTQEELGDLIGTKKATISNYETGYRSPKQDALFELADALGVSINDLFPPTKSKKASILQQNQKMIPIVGKVAAGTPNFAIEDVIGYMTIPPNKEVNKEMMYLEVSSDSMDKQFPIGSYVLVDRSMQIENGDVAIVKVNGDEATLKQVKFDYDKNEMYLIPNSHNENYYPQVVAIDENEVSIVGKVIGMYMSM